MAIDLNELRRELADLGLILRGILPGSMADGAGASGKIPEKESSSILIIGNEGSDLWVSERGGYPNGASAASEDVSAAKGAGARELPATKAVSGNRDPALHPLDAWTKHIVDEVADRLGGEAFYPFGGPPWHPFQRWAMAAEPVFPSPIGMLIHPDYGLWHAYRAAILVPEVLDPGPRDERQSPCLTCADTPCLVTCPVNAFKDMRKSDGIYDVPRCAAHIATEAGADCLNEGCRARRACPIGEGHHYAPGQAGFHMRAFLRARSAEG